MNDLPDDEIEVMAAEMWKLGAKDISLDSKRRMVAHGKINRDFVQDKSHVDLDGKISFSS